MAIFFSVLFSGCGIVGGQAEKQEISQPKAEPQTTAADSKTQPPAAMSNSPAQPEPPASGAVKATTRHNGANGQVRLIQIRLKAAGFDPGRVDGIMGPRTKAALQKYQAARGLADSGKPDEKTLKSLGVE
jgi:peptidoglycan hydrolase-like protein with peptidoglycan-binding domain